MNYLGIKYLTNATDKKHILTGSTTIIVPANPGGGAVTIGLATIPHGLENDEINVFFMSGYGTGEPAPWISPDGRFQLNYYFDTVNVYLEIRFTNSGAATLAQTFTADYRIYAT
jgi:hypothetical protein